MNKKIFLLLFVCCAALGISSCGDSHEKRARLSKAEKARLDSIDRASFKVGVMPTLDCLPVLVARIFISLIRWVWMFICVISMHRWTAILR